MEKAEDKRAARKSKVQPSQRDRRVKGATRVPGAFYRTRAYAHAIVDAATAAGVEVWRPNRLRHLHGTRVRHAFNLEAAAATLRHADVTTTLIYAERRDGLSAEVAEKLG